MGAPTDGFTGLSSDRGSLAYRTRARVLDVQLCPPLEPRVVSVTISVDNPRTLPTDAAALPRVEAIVTWGTTVGKRHEARVTVGRGTTFAVNCTELVVELENMQTSVNDETAPPAQYVASASLGGSARIGPPYFHQNLGTAGAGDITAPIFIPRFASRVLVLHAGAPTAHQLEFLEGSSVANPDAVTAHAQGEWVPCPPHCDRLRVRNTSGGLGGFSALFELTF